jgi:hypothetical protein
MLQVIHKGKTNQVIPDVTHPRLVQHNRAESHFQNGETFKLWLSDFLRRLQQARRRLSVPDDTKALLIIDAAGQHAIDETRALLAQHHCAVVQIPPKTTHVFQPADQFIIANIKRKAVAAYNDWLTEIFRNQSLSEAARVATATSIPVLRKLKVSFLVRALSTGDWPVVQQDIVLSWRKTCLLRELFGEHLGMDTPYDQAVYVANIEADAAADLAAFDEPNSSEDESESDDAAPEEAAQEESAAAQEEAAAEAPEPQAGIRRGRPKDPNSQRAQKEAKKQADEERAKREQPTLLSFFAKKATAPASQPS